MKTESAIWILIIVVVLAVIWAFNSRTPNVAMVNGQPITAAQFQEELGSIPVEYYGLVSEDLLLDQMINQRLLLDQARMLGISAADEDKAVVMDGIRQLVPPGTNFSDYLAEQEVTEAELREEIERQLIIAKLIDEAGLLTVSVSEEEIREFYEENRIGNISLEDLHDYVEQLLMLQKQQDSVAGYIKSLRKNSTIRILLPEYWSLCFSRFNISKGTVIYYYSRSCGFCVDLLPVIDSLPYSFHIAEASENTEALDTCIENLGIEVPKLVCTSSGKVLRGAVPESAIRSFAESC
ncbi:MAG: SurA N-terminal domain-containing protein [archaeon]